MNGEYKIGDVVLGNWTLNRLIGEGSYGRVYEASRKDFGVTYKAAIKIITIPQNKSEVDSVRAEGMDEKSITAYFRGLVEEIVQEFSLMSKLKGTANVVSYEDHTVVPHTDGFGWDIIIRMELLTPLLKRMSQGLFSRQEAIKLGIDLCRALELCQRFNIIHRDIKPENIFVSELGDYKLGDFGIARTVEKTTGGLSQKGTYAYMAPEVYKEDAYGFGVDIYSLGLVLYRLLNDNRMPFLPPYPEQISHSEREKALSRRMSGEDLPAPRHADEQLARIIRKACAYEPKDRYSDPTEMRQELEGILYGRGENRGIYEAKAAKQITDSYGHNQLSEEKTESAFGNKTTPTTLQKEDAVTSAFCSCSAEDTTATAATEGAFSSYDALKHRDDREEKKLEREININRWIIGGLCVIVAILAVVLAGDILRPDMITIDNMTVTDQTVDSITVSVETAEDPTTFEVVCVDAYGNEFHQPYTGAPNVFENLPSGTPCTIYLSGIGNVDFDGVFSITGSTRSTTEVGSFTVNRSTVSELELSFIVDGSEPEEWTVSFGPTGQATKTKVFSGHSTVLTGLEPDTEYTITLLAPKDIHLSGMTTLMGRTLPSVTMDAIEATLSGSTATLTWTFTGAAPDHWNVTITGPDGYSDNRTVTESLLILEDLKAGETYSILITCDNMEQAASTSITPHSTDVVEAQEASGNPDGGDTTEVEFTGHVAEKFEDLGFTSGYVSMWLRPAKEEWNINDLGILRTTFTKAEAIAFVCESINYPKDSNEIIEILLIVRDAEGVVVDRYAGEEVWNDMWTKQKYYVGELIRTPQEPGTYTLEFYFNGKIVDTGTSAMFTIR